MPEAPIGVRHADASGLGPLQHLQLMAQRQDLEVQGRT
jgi:hypothetical protein